jgi:Peptidase family M23
VKKFLSLATLATLLLVSFIAPSSSFAAVSSNNFIKPTEGTLSSGFRTSQRPDHQGIDLSQNDGKKVVASAAGTISKSYYSSSYGNVIFIKHNIGGREYETVYAHLLSRSVSAGDSVYQGQLIGRVGSTGDSTGPHLHFEIHQPYWTSSKTYAVNPLSYIRLEEGYYRANNFTYHDGTDTAYPVSYGGNGDLNIKVTSSSATNGEIKVYLQRKIDGNWTTVAHSGTPKNGTRTITFTREYDTSSLYQYTQYRFLLDNPDTTNVSYQAWYW